MPVPARALRPTSAQHGPDVRGHSRPDEEDAGIEAATGRSWSAVSRLARDQHGVVSRSQLRALGFSDTQVTGALARARLHPVHRGVFALGHDRVTALGRASAAVLACGAGAAVAYRTSAAVWTLRPSSSPRVEVLVPRRSTLSRAGVVVHCHPTAGADEITVHDGVPVTTVARTLLDLAVVLSRDGLRNAIKQAEVLGVFDLFEVRRLLDRHPRHRGAKALRDVLASWEDPARTRSDLEIAFVGLCTRHGLPVPLMNGLFDGMELDAQFPDHGIAVELDSSRFHENPLQREDDYAKRARVEAAGWRFVAFTHRQVSDDGGAFPAGILRRMMAAQRG